MRSSDTLFADRRRMSLYARRVSSAHGGMSAIKSKCLEPIRVALVILGHSLEFRGNA